MGGKTTNLRAALVNGMAFVSLADLDTWADNWLAQVCEGGAYDPSIARIVFKPTHKLPTLPEVLADFKEQLLEISEQIDSRLRDERDEGDGDIFEPNACD